jgi:hypothetical protein
MSTVISQELLDQALTWEQYYAMAAQYVPTEGRPDMNREPSILPYIVHNIHRMDVVLDSMSIDSKLYNLVSTSDMNLTWLLLADPDYLEAAEILPVIYTMASCNDLISIRIMLSDEQHDLRSIYIIYGRQSIPILICLDASTRRVMDTWCMRPLPLQAIVKEMEYKNISQQDIDQTIQQWYAEDKTKSLQSELIDRIKIWMSKS